MSALKEVKEDRLTPAMRDMVTKALAAKPLEGSDYERLLMRMSDSAGRRSARLPTGKAICTLPPDHDQKPVYVDHTPRDWRHVSIAPAGDKFRLVHQGSHVAYLPGDKQILSIVALETENLTLEQAVRNGFVVETREVKLKAKQPTEEFTINASGEAPHERPSKSTEDGFLLR